MRLCVVCDGREPNLANLNRSVSDNWHQSSEMIAVVVCADDEVDSSSPFIESANRFWEFFVNVIYRILRDPTVREHAHHVIF